MALPATPTVRLRLGIGSAFGDVLVLGSSTDGILGTNVLGTATAQVVDISSTTQRISIRRGRDRIFEEYSPGQATVRFLDLTGDWNPENTSSPYYGKILPMSQVKITTTYSGTGYNLFTGFITSWNWEWADQAADYAIVTLQAIDAFRLLSLSNITTVTGATAGELPGPRISDILNTVSWPSQLTNLGTGDTVLQADPGTARTALDAIQLVEKSDLGAFFMDGDGKATYLSRAQLAAKASSTATVFRDDGTGIQYQKLDIDLDDTDLANQVTIGRIGGTDQTVSDSASITQYFLRSFTETGLMMNDDTTALARARSILYYRKTPRLRIDSITLDLSSPSNRVQPGLALDIGDPIEVIRTMAGTSTLDLRIQVNGINHDITPERWFTQFTTAYPLSQAFILGNSLFGILGTSTL